MKVLVTGHRGYIGTVLTEMLVKRQHQVVGIDSDLFAQCTFGDEQAFRVPALESDIRELSAAQLRGFDAILHLAGVCNDPWVTCCPRPPSRSTERATIRLAQPRGRAGVPAVRLLLPAAASTAAPSRIGSTRPARSTRSLPMAPRSTRLNAACWPSPMTASRRSCCAARPPTASRPGSASISSSTTSSPMR